MVKMKKEEVRIELTVTSALDLMSLGTEEVVDLEHAPYKEFIVSFPSEKIDEEKFDDIVGSVTRSNREFASKLSRKEKMALIKDYNDCNIDILVKVSPNTIVVGTKEWFLKLDTNSSVFSLEKKVDGIDIEIEFVTNNEKLQLDYNESEEFRKGLTHYMFGVLGLISFMQSDKMNVIEPSTRLQLDDSKKKKGKSKNKKTYIYKKKYVIDDSATKDIKDSSREYNRKVDQWMRRGHFRKYKNGKKIWIDSKVCRANGSVDNPIAQEYKITKIK